MDAPRMPAPRRRGLGRGLDALLGDAPRHRHDTPAGDEEGVFIEIDPATVRPNPEQPRREFDEAGLESLAESIRRDGLLHPIVVERTGDHYQLVAGERRLRAARLAGRRAIPALVRPASESARHQLELALTENLLRTDLSPLDEAAAYARLADTFGLSHEAIALRVGRSRSAVTNTVRLLTLPAPVQAALSDGRLDPGHARAILSAPGADRQVELAARVEARGLSVRETEREALAMHDEQPRGAPAPASRAPATPAPSRDDTALERGLEDALGTAVHLQRRRRGGRLVIEFFSDEELDALYTRLGGTPP